MANHKSAIKRHRQSLKRRERNRETKAAVRSAIRKARTAGLEGKSEEAATLIRQAERMLAKAAAKGILHKKNASRRASRLASVLKTNTKK